MNTRLHPLLLWVLDGLSEIVDLNLRLVPRRDIPSAILGFILGLLGGWDVLMEGLLIACAVDMLLGMSRAWLARKFSSTKMRKGAMKKACYFIALFFLCWVDRYGQSMGLPAGTVHSWLTLVFIGVEATSIVEHMAALKLMPAAVADRLEKVLAARLKE